MHQVIIDPGVFHQAAASQLFAGFADLLAPLLHAGGIRSAHEAEGFQLERVRLPVRAEIVEHPSGRRRQLAVLLPYEFRVVVASKQHDDFLVDQDLATGRFLATVQDAEAVQQRHRFQVPNAVGREVHRRRL